MDQELETNERRNDERRSTERRDAPTKSFDANGFVFREHETAQEAYIVKSGNVRIFKTVIENGDSREVTLDILKEGAMFGEMALIDDKPRMASARAHQGPLSVYVISQSQFKGLLETANPFVMKLLGILTNLARVNNIGKNMDEPASNE